MFLLMSVKNFTKDIIWNRRSKVDDHVIYKGGGVVALESSEREAQRPKAKE